MIPYFSPDDLLPKASFSPQKFFYGDLHLPLRIKVENQFIVRKEGQRLLVSGILGQKETPLFTLSGGSYWFLVQSDRRLNVEEYQKLLGFQPQETQFDFFTKGQSFRVSVPVNQPILKGFYWAPSGSGIYKEPLFQKADEGVVVRLRRQTTPEQRRVDQPSTSMLITSPQEIASMDMKAFVTYMNSLYGPKGRYPDKKGRKITQKDVELALQYLIRRFGGKYDWQWHTWTASMHAPNRDHVRDTLIGLGRLDPNYSSYPYNKLRPLTHR